MAEMTGKGLRYWNCRLSWTKRELLNGGTLWVRRSSSGALSVRLSRDDRGNDELKLHALIDHHHPLIDCRRLQLVKSLSKIYAHDRFWYFQTFHYLIKFQEGARISSVSREWDTVGVILGNGRLGWRPLIRSQCRGCSRGCCWCIECPVSNIVHDIRLSIFSLCCFEERVNYCLGVLSLLSMVWQ